MRKDLHTEKRQSEFLSRRLSEMERLLNNMADNVVGPNVAKYD